MGCGGRPGYKSQIPNFLVRCRGRWCWCFTHSPSGPLQCLGEPSSKSAALLPPKACTCNPPLEAADGPRVQKSRQAQEFTPPSPIPDAHYQTLWSTGVGEPLSRAWLGPSLGVTHTVGWAGLCLRCPPALLPPHPPLFCLFLRALPSCISCLWVCFGEPELRQ